MKFNELSCILSCSRQRNREKHSGFALIEVLVAALIIAVIALAVTVNTVGALKVSELTDANFAAVSLAISKIEELAAINTANLSDDNDSEETQIAWSGTNLTFTRTVNVTVNDDNSRTLDVSVSSESAKVPANATFSTTFAQWE